MGDQRAAVLWTDPPYGVSYVGKTADALEIHNDGPNAPAVLLAALRTVTPFLEPGAPFYLASPAGTLATDLRLALREAGWPLHQALVWAKDRFVLGHSDYHYQHEDILYGWVPGPGRSGRGDHAGSRWYGDHAQTSVLRVDRPSRNAEHPTMKPPDLIALCLQNSSPPKALVLDIFAGSGSTAVAAEQTGRLGYGIEIDPGYVAVILQRLTDMGLEPRRLDGAA